MKTSDIEYIFLYLLAIRTSYEVAVHLLFIILLVICLLIVVSVLKVFCIKWIVYNSFLDISFVVLEVFSVSLCLPFYFLSVVFWRAGVFSFDEVQFVRFFFFDDSWFLWPKNSTPKSQGFSPLLFFLIALGFMVRIMFHFEFTFVYGVRVLAILIGV